jgi:hypothetical protein
MHTNISAMQYLHLPSCICTTAAKHAEFGMSIDYEHIQIITAVWNVTLFGLVHRLLEEHTASIFRVEE